MSKHQNELQRLAEQRGWKKKSLSRSDIAKMTADESDWHSRFNSEEFNRAWDEKKTKAADQKTVEDAKVQRIWQDQATPEEADTAVKEAKNFTAAYPQYVSEGESGQINGKALLAWLQERKLLFTAQNAASALQELGREGKLILSPAKVRIVHVRFSNGTSYDIRKESLPVYERRDPNLTVSEDEEVTGARLSRHVLLDVLLSPYNAGTQSQREQDGLSADAYKNKTPELNAPTPSEQERHDERERREVATFFSFYPTIAQTKENGTKLQNYLKEKGLEFTRRNLENAWAALADEIATTNAVVSSSGTRLVDLSGTGAYVHNVQTGMPQKDSLAYKVRKMNSREYEEFIANPANRRALDEAAV